MEFLKNVLGDSFADVSERIGRYNREHPENQVKLADLSEGKYVSKAKFCDLEAEAKRLKELLSSQHSEDDPDGPEQKLAELKQKYDKDTEALKTELKQAKFNGALDLALERSGAKNTKAVRALLDLDSLERAFGTFPAAGVSSCRQWFFVWQGGRFYRPCPGRGVSRDGRLCCLRPGGGRADEKVTLQLERMIMYYGKFNYTGTKISACY